MFKQFLSFFVIITFPMSTCFADPSNTLPVQTMLPTQAQQMQPVEQLKPIVIKPVALKEIQPPALAPRIKNAEYGDFLAYASLEERKPAKKIALVKVNNTRKKQAFMFVFLMNRQKPQEAPKEDLAKKRKHMHIMWTGSKKLMPKQKNIENKYPIDVSIDNYSDGFVPGEWNLALPDKKPREVSISFLWSF